MQTTMLAALATLLGLLAAPAAAQILDPDDVELADVVEVQRLGRDLLAYAGSGSGRVLERLELNEEVLSQAAEGRIGLVLTDRRALAVSPGFPWSEARYRFTEKREDGGLIGDRIALVVTSQRLLGYNAGIGSWQDEGIGPGEEIRDTQLGPSTAVVVTGRRAIGMSPNSGGFVDIDLRVHEKLERISTRSGVATVTTSQRVLIFQGANARWVVQRRKINE